jgi:4-diphosphocytidyl-2-C-methyl-D-erythritol kinase
MFSKPLSPSEMARLAVRLGADVPFFLENRPCLATGIGEVLEPIASWPLRWYLIVHPPIAVSTAWAYNHLNLELTTGEYDYIVKLLQRKRPTVTDILENDLETVTARHHPVINTIKDLLVDAGAEGALMTGSGPCVFGVFQSRHRALAGKKHLVSQNLGDVFLATHFDEKMWGPVDARATLH